MNKYNIHKLSHKIIQWGKECGFQAIGISDIHLEKAEKRLAQFLTRGFHGEMEWMARHGTKRSRPAELVPKTVSIISARMDYLPPNGANPAMILQQTDLAYISRYALGRDYHKVLRQRLKKLAHKISTKIGPFGHRVFVDSAPVLEKAIAVKAGLGWQGKHTNLINKKAGSWFFLGEIYTDLKLVTTQMEKQNLQDSQNSHCGTCTACIDICPTKAIIKPYQLDARRCISYLTIELKGAIPEKFRPLIGNRIYGCDDCQLFCPWNRFAQTTKLSDFTIRNKLDEVTLLELFAWTEKDFLKKLEGSPIRRLGYKRWLRNIAIALGNAPANPIIYHALQQKLQYPSELVREHVKWALKNQQNNINKSINYLNHT